MAPKIYLAIVPSNQDKPGTDVAFPWYSEMASMTLLGEAVKKYANIQSDFMCETFWSWPESEDGKHSTGYSFPGLRKQTRDSHFWLNAQPDGIKAALHLHTNAVGSGNISQIVAVYGKNPNQAKENSTSWKLSMVTANEVEKVLKTGKVMDFEHSDYIYYTLEETWTSSLLEVCSHDVKTNIEMLAFNFTDVAKAIVNGVLKYAGRPVPIALIPQNIQRARNELLAGKEAINESIDEALSLLKG